MGVMGVDFDELRKQEREEIMKDGNYLLCEIIVNKKTNTPFVQTKCIGDVDSRDMAVMLKVLDFTQKKLKSYDPLAYKLSKKFKCRKSKTLKVDRKTNNITEI